MRISPLALTIILALLTGVIAIAVWALLAGHFATAGTPVGNNSTGEIDLTDVTLLSRYMPLPPNGWVLNNSSGEVVVNDPEYFSYARDDYLKPGTNTTACVVVYDSSGKDILWNSIFRTGFIYENGDGYAKVYAYKGKLAWETASYGEGVNDYSQYVRLNDRYGIAILLKNASDRSPLNDFADRINIYGILGLRGQ